jgi:hypothetical protein
VILKSAEGKELAKSNNTITINAAVSVTAASDSKPYDGTPLVNVNYTVVGLPAGHTLVATVIGSQTEVGNSANVVDSWTITRNSDGADVTGSFTVTPVPGLLAVTKSNTVTAASATKTYDGTPLVDDGVTTTGLPAGHTLTATVVGSQTDVGSSANTITAWTITRNSDGANVTGNFTVTPVAGLLTVTQSNTVTVTAASDSKPYDGTALTNASVSTTGLPAGHTLTAAVVGSQTEVGSSANIVTAWTITRNSDGRDVTSYINAVGASGTLTVVPAATTVIVTAASDSKPYDGAPLVNTNYTVVGLPAGHTLAATIIGSQTEVGDSANVVDSWTITRNSDGADVTGNFVSIGVSGRLTVVPASTTVIVTAASDSKSYDGTPLVNANYAVAGLPAGHTLTATFIGTQTEVGYSANVVDSWTITRDSDGADVMGNFTSVGVSGTLTVTPATIVIPDSFELSVGYGNRLATIYGNPLAYTDGELAAIVLADLEDYIATNYPSVDLSALGLAVTVSSAAIGEFVGEYSYAVDVSYNRASFVITGLGNVRLNHGIEPRPLTLTAESASKVYDGTVLTWFWYSIGVGQSVRLGDDLYVEITGGQLAVGSSANVITLVELMRGPLDVTSNYAIVLIDGTLTVTAAGGTTPPAPVTPPPATPAPVVTGPAAPAPAAPAPAVTAPAPDDTTIPDPSTPITSGPSDPDGDETGDVTIVDEETPLSLQWALLNLLLALIAIIFAFVLIIHAFTGRRKGEDQRNAAKGTKTASSQENVKGNSGLAWRLIAILAGVAAPIVFLLTEDVTLPMGIIDIWTPLMAVIVIVQIGFTLILWQARKPKASQDSGSVS